MPTELSWVEEGARSPARVIESLDSKSNKGSTVERACGQGLMNLKVSNGWN